MGQPTLSYQRNRQPSRPLALAGAIPPFRILLALPHIWVVGVLTLVSQLAAYVGFWIVAVKEEYPEAIHTLIEGTLRWSARTWAWTTGLIDAYPPFETDPTYPVDIPWPRAEAPNRRWAIAGTLVFPKVVAILPHMVAGALLSLAAGLAAWAGQWMVLFTGRLPAGIQDFVAGVIQWNTRWLGWLAGLTDQYPPFKLDAQPS